jgi:hypothetical protein
VFLENIPLLRNSMNPSLRAAVIAEWCGSGGAASIALLKIDPVWDPIRNRPDFQQLLSGPEQIGPNK